MFRGYDYNEGREVAWIEIYLNSKEDNFNKISLEINIMKKLYHPNIIQFISGWYNENEKKIIMITELVSGGSLKENLERIGNPRLSLIKKWIIEILNGISYLHSNNIIHRDIKCDNIFFDRITGNVKIGDLGLCRMIKEKKNFCTHFKGTEEFMAPEVHEGKYSFKADIYSLGITIIEMITNEKPYNECDSTLKIYDNIKNGIYPNSLFKVDNEGVINFIKLCLKKENERPSADELLNNKWLNDFESKDNFESIKVVSNKSFKKFKSENINKDIDIKIESDNNKVSQSPNPYSFTQQKKIFFNSVRKTSCDNLSSNSNLLQRKNTSVNISVKDSIKENINLDSSIQIQFIIGKKEWKNKSKFFL